MIETKRHSKPHPSQHHPFLATQARATTGVYLCLTMPY